MSFSTVADVRAIVDSDVTDAEITDLINRTDQRIIAKVGSSANSLLLEDLSATWTAFRVMLKDAESRALGEYREDRSKALDWLRSEIDDMLQTIDGGISVVATRSELS